MEERTVVAFSVIFLFLLQSILHKIVVLVVSLLVIFTCVFEYSLERDGS